MFIVIVFMLVKNKEANEASYQNKKLTFVFFVDWRIFSLSGLLCLCQV